MTEPLVALRDVRIDYDGQAALDVPALDVVEHEVLAVIGPNGAGKSTLLQVMAGLLNPQRGGLRFRGQPVRPGDLGYRRRTALVLQVPVLLDTSVLNNIMLGLRFRRLPKGEARERALAWAKRLGVAHLAGRRARTLSGGEAQRTSLARALALAPDLLLLDEPFAALDAPTRSALLGDMRQLLREAHTTAVFVTHDQDEALSLGDRVAVLLKGRLCQIDVPERVFSMPLDEEVAAFVGMETTVPGHVVALDDGLARVQVGEQSLSVLFEGMPDEDVLICLRPEDVTLMASDTADLASSARNRVSGRVRRLSPRGRLYYVTVDCGFTLTALITPQSLRELGLVEGKPVIATFKATAAHVIRRGRPGQLTSGAEGSAFTGSDFLAPNRVR